MFLNIPPTDQIDVFAKDTLVRDITIHASLSRKSIASFCIETFKFYNLPFNELIILINYLVENQFLQVSQGVLEKGNCYPYEQFEQENVTERVTQVEQPEKTMPFVSVKAIPQYSQKYQNIDEENKKSSPKTGYTYNHSNSLSITPCNSVAELGLSSAFDLQSTSLTSVDSQFTNYLSTVNCGGSETSSWVDFITNSSMSRRAIRVLLKNCSSFEELLSLDSNTLSTFRNCGRNTISEIIEFQNRMRIAKFAPNIPLQPLAQPIADILRLPPSEDSLRLLPVFSWTQVHDITADELHGGFHAETQLADVVLSVRTASVLDRLGFKTIGDVMFVSGAILLAQKNFGRKCFDEIQKVIRNIVLQENNQVETFPDDPVYCMSSVDSNGTGTGTWTELIANSSLSVRATNVLLNNCASVEDLLSLDEKALLNLKNCGRNTLSEIIEFQNRTRIGKFAPALWLRTKTQTVADILRQPPTEDSLPLLPIFSWKHFIDISANEIHEGFHAEVRLSDIVLSVRTASVLDCLGYKTIGDILFVPGARLLEQKNFGRKSLRELQDAIGKVVLPENNQSGGRAEQLDYSSYSTLIESFVGHCLEKRNQELVSRRLCFQTGKSPTLEQLGEQFSITRERARQILKKGYRTLKIKINLNLLKEFREDIEHIVTSGGGLISLGNLSLALQKKYGWPRPPHPPALEQLLLLIKSDQWAVESEDLLRIECECLTCEKSFDKLLSFDFDEHESIHIQVAASNLAKHCLMTCTRKTEQIFHSAYIEMLVGRTHGNYIIHDDLIMSRDKWLPRHSTKLEDIIIHVLERNGKPMHFSEITPVIQKENLKHRDISDHNVHASLMRFDAVEIIGRGTYGLKSWGLGGYRSVSTAIEELLDANDRPLRRAEIIQQLGEEFAEGNITSSLGKETRFVNIGEGFYDRLESWKKRTCESLINHLPEPLAEFARYLVNNNNCSYKFVLALVFIRGMEENGSFYLPTLKERFFIFYQNRKKRNLVVEIDSASISRIGGDEDSAIKNHAVTKPITSFLGTPFFVQNGTSIFLQGLLVSLLSDQTMRDVLILIFLKKIDDYYRGISPAVFNQDVIINSQSDINSIEKDIASPLSITIKKKDRGKIRL